MSDNIVPPVSETRVIRVPLDTPHGEAARGLADTRHADSAYAWQFVTRAPAAETPASETPASETPAGETPLVETPGYGQAHDAHMRATYADPWDAMPRDDPRTGDPLTGTYGRTYAESGYLAMQASADMFGPLRGHCPVLLFTVATEQGEPLRHSPMGGARLTHVATCDTWDAALRAMRTMIDGDTFNATLTQPGTYPGTCLGCTAQQITQGHREDCPDRWII